MIAKAEKARPQIQEENWRVGDKIRIIRRLLQEQKIISLVHLLSPEKSRPELIVIFLAILELMKIGELAVGREQETGRLVALYKKEENPL
jgi:segregation and condensation protein A